MRTDSGDFFWDVGSLPFVWEKLSQSRNRHGMPNTLPFVLLLDEKSGLLMQAPNNSVSRTLSKAYLKGSMVSGMMEDRGIGKNYAEDFLSFLKIAIHNERFDGLNVLEIGCGTGYLLYKLQQLGARCIGIEPGEYGQNGANIYQLEIVKDFFPSKKIKGTFDVILFSAVLEHIENPFNFLLYLKSYLKPNGIIVLSVPDCEPYIDAGDISFLLHEHWSYFTKKTLKNILILAGAYEINIKQAGFGGMLYASAKFYQDSFEKDLKVISCEIEKAMEFRRRSQTMISRLSSIVQKIHAEGKTLAIYVPGRAINSLIISEVNLSCCRFFDDDPSLHGTYFPGINISIEPRQNLIDKSTDLVMIMSYNFSEKIERELRAALPPTTIIKTWENFFGTDYKVPTPSTISFNGL